MIEMKLKAALAAGCCALALGTSAFAEQSGRRFDVPAGDMKTALDAYARQSRTQIIYRSDDLAGLRSPGVRGEFSADVALARLVQGGQLELRRGEGGVVAVVRKRAAAPTSSARLRTPVSWSPARQQIPGAPVAAAEAAPQEVVSSVEEIVVTGSRIARRDYSANSPIVTVGTEALESTGAPTVETYLNQLPQFVGGATSSSNSPGNAGQANLNLRGLGSYRTLVLLDGRRLVPANADGSVDVNIIPRALVQNVEVITGGASATYGSDAIAGVVNFKLRTDFEGVLYDAQYGISDRGDAETYDLSAVFGGNFAEGRGNAVIALGYSQRDVVYGDARDFTVGWGASSTVPQGTYAAVGTNLPTQAAMDAVFAGYGVAPGTVRPNANLSFNPDGSLFSATGGIHNYQGESSDVYDASGPSFTYAGYGTNLIQLPLERYTAFGRGTYDLGRGVEAFGQVLFSQYEARTLQAAAPAAGNPNASGTGFWMPVTNPFIPDDLATILASRPDPDADFLLNKRLVTTGGRSRTTNYLTYQLSTGVKGDLPAIDGGWEVVASYGRNEASQTLEGSISHSAVDTLFAAPDGGASLCEGGYNPFGLTELSAECTDYLSRRAKNTTVVEQRNVEANIQGHLVTLPAGEARFAAGLSYREDAYEFVPDYLVQGGDVIGMLAQLPLTGSTNVSEVYGELLLPVLANLPFIQTFEVGLGYRYSDYSSVGGVQSYKIDGDWQVVPSLRLRGGYQRAVRAPSIGELFAPPARERPSIGAASATGTTGDPCDVRGSFRNGPDAAAVRALCLAQGVPGPVIDAYTYTNTQSYGTTAGNQGLQEETADTYSFGAVWRSEFANPWLAGVTVSLDYYNIKVEDAVGYIGAATSIRNCFNVDGANPTYSLDNLYCQAIERDSATGDILNVDEALANLGEIQTAGVDLAFDWRADLAELGLGGASGTLGLNVLTSYLDHYKIRELPGGPLVDYAGSIGSTLGSAYPEWKLATALSYEVGPLRASLRWRRIDAMLDRSLVGAGDGAVAVSPPTTDYFDLDARWTLNETIDLRAGVINIGDEAPPYYTSEVQMNTDPSTYDTLGRRYYIGLRARF